MTDLLGTVCNYPRFNVVLLPENGLPADWNYFLAHLLTVEYVAISKILYGDLIHKE
jgi:hypothetical protein